MAVQRIQFTVTCCFIPTIFWVHRKKAEVSLCAALINISKTNLRFSLANNKI